MAKRRRKRPPQRRVRVSTPRVSVPIVSLPPRPRRPLAGHPGRPIRPRAQRLHQRKLLKGRVFTAPLVRVAKRLPQVMLRQKSSLRSVTAHPVRLAPPIRTHSRVVSVCNQRQARRAALLSRGRGNGRSRKAYTDRSQVTC